MSAAVVPWLPAAAPGEEEAALAAFVRDWAAQWFVNLPVLRVATGKAARIGDSRYCLDPLSCASAGEADVFALGFQLVGEQAHPDNRRDRDILGTLGKACFDALAHQLDEIRGGTSGDPAAYRLIGEGQGWSIELMLDRAALNRLRKLAAGPGRAKPQLGSRSAALAPERIALGCRLGKSALTAAQLSQLAQGDVIVLDRKVNEALALTLGAQVASRGQGKIEPHASGPVLRIIESLDTSIESKRT